MKDPEVSVVVPIYNGAAHLVETLNSLLSQTFTNFQLLAIDDGSTDESVEIVNTFRDKRLRLIQKKNGGLCHALNLGITESSATFIARSDQDDISVPSRLERQLEVMNRFPEALGLFAYPTKFGSRHTWSNADRVVLSPGAVKQFKPFEDGCLLGSTMFMRKDALQRVGGFRKDYYPSDDWDLELRLSELGTVLVLREALIAYRFHANANTYRVFAAMCQKRRWAEDSHQRRRDSVPELTFQQFEQLQSHDLWTRLRRHRKDASKLHMRTAGQEYLDGNYAACAFHLAASIASHPADLLRRLRLLGWGASAP